MNGGKWETLIMHMIIGLFTYYHNGQYCPMAARKDSLVGVTASGSSDGGCM